MQEKWTSQEKTNLIHIRDLFFSHLLGGGAFQNRQPLLEEAEEAGVRFPHPWFVVVAYQPVQWGALFDLESPEVSGAMDLRDMHFILRNVMENGFGQGAVVEAAHYRGQMVGVVNLPSLPSSGVRSVVWDAKQQAATLEEEFGLTVSAAVSRVYDSLLQAADGYADTVRIFDYLQVIGKDRQVTSYDELTHHQLPPSATRYLQLEGKMLSCIQVSDYEGLRRVIHEMVTSEFRQARPTIDTFRFRVYGMVNSLLFMMDEIHHNVGDEFFAQLNPGPRLCEAESLNQVMLEMDQILDELSAHAEQLKKDALPSWLTKLKAYVDENFSDINVTVASLADRFGVGASHCSRVFKQHYGVGLFDYVQRLRLEKAKSLMHSGSSVKAIAEQCGFSSGLTMNRAFKRYEGTTPSKFREAAQEESLP